MAEGTFVATGELWPDALTGSALAAHRGVPVNLTKSAHLPQVTAAELERLTPGAVTVLGGPVAVTEQVISALNMLLNGQ